MYMRTFGQLLSTSSRLKKIQYLKEANDDYILKNILLYAYHPMWHYYVTNVKAVGQGQGTLERFPWMTLLDQLKSRELSGHIAKTVVKDFITSLTPENGELFKKILKKNLRVGINTATINASYKNFQIPVFGAMLAKAYSDWTKPMYMSLKYDGLRAVLKEGILYTRNGHVIQGVDHILKQAKELNLNSLDGELMIPDMPFQESSGLIRSFEACPTAVYKVFDIPEETSPFKTRYEALVEYFAQNSSLPNVSIVKHAMANSEATVRQTFNKALIAGYEGLVLKDPDHLYVPKRSSSWLKLKNTLTIDLPVVAYFAGQGKYENNLGGLVVQTNDAVLVRVGGGFSDAQRTEIWNTPQKYMGLTIEIDYHEETPDGSLRHPRFKGFRLDK